MKSQGLVAIDLLPDGTDIDGDDAIVFAFTATGRPAWVGPENRISKFYKED